MLTDATSEQKKDYLCYMNRRYYYQLAIVLFAIALYLYFWLGWIAVAVYLVAVVLLVVLLFRLKRRDEQYSEIEPLTTDKVLAKDYDALNLERRRAQVERVISFAEAISRSELGMERLAKRFDDWYLEYAHSKKIYHIDLYDFILEQCKERLKSAKADYLKGELRLSIDIVRQLMRGRTVEQIIDSIDKK